MGITTAMTGVPKPAPALIEAFRSAPVVGDEDGVVSFPSSVAPSLLEAVRAQVAREEETIISIRAGPLPGQLRKILIETHPTLGEER